MLSTDCFDLNSQASAGYGNTTWTNQKTNLLYVCDTTTCNNKIVNLLSLIMIMIHSCLSDIFISIFVCLYSGQFQHILMFMQCIIVTAVGAEGHRGVALTHPSVSSSCFQVHSYCTFMNALSFQSIPTHNAPVSVFMIMLILFLPFSLTVFFLQY